MTPAAIGIDFGTTNSVVALAGPDGSVMTRSFATKQGAVDAYRSALMFWRLRPDDGSSIGVDRAFNLAFDRDGETVATITSSWRSTRSTCTFSRPSSRSQREHGSVAGRASAHPEVC